MSMKPDFPVFIISLSDSGRRTSVTEECNRYNLTPFWVDAVDLRLLSVEEVRQYYQPIERALRKKQLLKPAEIGCALSHRYVYRQMLEHNIPFALVLEDDVRFLSSPNDVLEYFSEMQSQMVFDVLILGYVKVLTAQLPYYYRRIPIKKKGKIPNYCFGTPWEQYGCGTVAYLITLAGVQKILSDGDKIRVTADDWQYFEKNCGLSVVHLRPSVAIEACDVFDSSIRTEKTNYLHPKWHSVIIRSIKGWLKNFGMNVLGMRG